MSHRSAPAAADDSLSWHCETNFIVCRNEHLLTFYHSGYSLDHRRMSGHAFIRCENCKPATCFFVVVSTTPDSHATCYAITEADWRRWANDKEPTTRPTPEMLYLLHRPDGKSWNPGWRPPK